MINEATSFWKALSGKSRELVQAETENAFRCGRFDVTTAPNGSVIGVTLPYGSNEILIPYSNEVASAAVGDTVLVVWWNNMSTAKAYYFGDGYAGFNANDAKAKLGYITTTTTWSGSDPYTQTVTVTGATVTANSKVDLQPSATVLSALLADGVTAVFVTNNAGALTMTALGAAPSMALTFQATVTEVS